MGAVLKLGSRGAYVVALQAGLNQRFSDLEPPLKLDGWFGPKTRARLIEASRSCSWLPCYDGTLAVGWLWLRLFDAFALALRIKHWYWKRRGIDTGIDYEF